MKKFCVGFVGSWLLWLLVPLMAAGQAPAKASLEGQWKGDLTVPGGSLPLAITVTELANGTRFGLLDLPKQRISRAMLQLTVSADTLLFVSDELGFRYRCQRTPDGQQLQGIWKQQGYTTPLTLQFVPLPAGPPKTFKFAPPYRVEEVSFTNSKANVQLSGTLTTPPGEGPFPAVMLLSDMGPHDRDASQGSYQLFGQLADYLTRHGIAVLRLDDRGVGQSGGSWQQTTTADLVHDAQLGLNYLRTRPLIDFAALGLIGHGEGGTVALQAAAQPLSPSFVVALGTSGLPGFEQLAQRSADFLPAGAPDTAQENASRQQLKVQQQIQQQADKLRASGANAAQVETYVSQQQLKLQNEQKKKADVAAKQQRVMLEVVQQTPDNGQAQAIITNMYRRYHPEADAAIVQRCASTMTSPWYRHYLKFDPQTNLANVKCAVLLLSGTDDAQASVAAQAPLLKILKSNKRVTPLRLDGVNHQMQAPPMEWPMLNGEQKPVLSAAVQKTITDWIKAQVSPMAEAAK